MPDPRIEELERRAAPFPLDRLGVRAMTGWFGGRWEPPAGDAPRFILTIARSSPRAFRQNPPEVYALTLAQARL